MNPVAARAAFLLTFLFALCGCGFAAILDDWAVGGFPRLRSNEVSGFGALAFGNGMFVAGGISIPSPGGCDCPDVIATSVDGNRWLTHTNENYNDTSAMIYDGGLFVAVNAGGIAYRVMVSANGVNWFYPVPGNFEIFYYDVAYGNGRYVAVGENWLNQTKTNVLVSTNGFVWTPSWLASTYRRARAVSFGNGVFVAIADTGPGTVSSVYFSATGIAGSPFGGWSVASGVLSQLANAAFGNGVFVLIGGNQAIIATNFSAGTPRSIITLPTTNSVEVLKFLNDTFLAFADRELLTSSNGYDWTNRGAVVRATDFPPYDIAYGNGRFVALAGTNYYYSPPLAPNVLHANRPAGSLVVWGEPGRQYLLESNDSLNSTSWQSLATLALTNSPWVWSDPASTNSLQRFYRTQLLP